MKIKLISIIFLFSLTIYTQSLPSKTEIIVEMKRVNDYWINNHPTPGDNDWARAAYFIGNMAFYTVFPYERYYQYADRWANDHMWSLNSGVTTRNADQQCCGQTYICLYELDSVKQNEKIADISENIQNMVNSTKADDWWWIDALFMSMPVFTKLGVIFNDTTYFEKLYKLYSNTKIGRHLYNDSSALWYRDETFLPPYQTPNGFDSYWSRGNGWVFAAHARTLENLPLSNPYHDEYLNTYKSMACALKQVQRSDGFWNVSLADPDNYGGPETSGTSFFTFGMAWGINQGILDSAVFYPVVAKAWNGLVTQAVHTDGKLGFIQGVGSNPSSSQPVTYETTADFGVGAFLLAGSEVVKLAQGEIPDPPGNIIDSVILISDTSLQIYCNETLEEKSAENPLNYRIDPEIIVTSASLSVDLKNIFLTFNYLEPGIYTLSIGDIVVQNGCQVDTNVYYSFIYNNIINVTASGYQQGTTNVPENAIDFDLDTRWSQEGDGEWILFELDTLRIVTSVDIAFYNGNQRLAYFDIQVSNDGLTFSKVFSGQSTGTSIYAENFDFIDTQARFIKIIGHGNSQSMWNSITWVKINTIKGEQVFVIPKREDSLKALIYPNPVNDNIINITINNNINENILLSIMDISGKEVYHQNIMACCYNHHISLDLNLHKGVYFVQFEGKNKSEVSKIIII